MLAITTFGYGQQDARINFVIKNAGVNVKGTFNTYNVTQKFVTDDLEGSSFTATIQSTTINTGIKGRDKHLRKAKYFDVENYPEIRFSSTSISRFEGKLLVKGNLTIKSTTKSIEIPVEIVEEEGLKWFKGYLQIDRREYGVGKNHLIMGNTVKINLAVPYSEN